MEEFRITQFRYGMIIVPQTLKTHKIQNKQVSESSSAGSLLSLNNNHMI